MVDLFPSAAKFTAAICNYCILLEEPGESAIFADIPEYIAIIFVSLQYHLICVAL